MQHGSGRKTELVLLVDGHGCRHKFLTLSTGSVSIMRSIGMSDVFTVEFHFYEKCHPSQVPVDYKFMITMSRASQFMEINFAANM